jgi:acyl-CoA reductase-like NAD-dependent aldehyde dehydrogenase
LLGSVAAGDAQDIDRAAAAAKAAFPGWRGMAGDKRRALLHRVADAIEARGEEIALVESVDTGQAIRFMLPAPFGGSKASGIGRDGGDYSFDFYMETKNVCVVLGTHHIAMLGTWG